MLLFLAIDRFEQGHKLVALLLGHGCSAGATRVLQLSQDGEPEPVTALIWALSRPLPGVSKSVLLTLLDRGPEGASRMNSICVVITDNLPVAKPDFTAPSSKTTALLEAAKSGRHVILNKLIELGVKVNIRDSEGRSPLLLASEAGDLECVRSLLNARVRSNDGSLHAAARGVHENIVRLLLDKGHTPNHIHAGRSALAELCLCGHPEDDDWDDKAHWVIDTLIKAGTKIEADYEGKNILHLALDNDMPVPVTMSQVISLCCSSITMSSQKLYCLQIVCSEIEMLLHIISPFESTGT